MTPALDDLAARASVARAEAARLYSELLDAVLEEAGRPGSNVRELAGRAGIARATIYNELGRRQQTRDSLSANGAPPPAPADTDEPADPPPRLSARQRAALLELERVRTGLPPSVVGGRRTSGSLLARGFARRLANGDLAITRAGELALSFPKRTPTNNAGRTGR